MSTLSKYIYRSKLEEFTVNEYKTHFYYTLMGTRVRGRWGNDGGDEQIKDIICKYDNVILLKN